MLRDVKNTLKTIQDSGISNNRCLGDLISSSLFSERAVFVDNDNNVYLLSSPDLKSKSDTETDLLIIDFISTLKELESSQLIFVVPGPKEKAYPILFYSGATQCTKMQFEGYFDIGNGKTLILTQDSAKIEESGVLVLVGELLPKIIGKIVFDYLTGIVYSTEGLKKYINQGFITEEKRLAKRANRISFFSVLVAILVAISAPFLTVWWSNSHGKATIINTQYEQLITEIGSIGSQLRDTISVQEISPKQTEPIKKNKNK